MERLPENCEKQLHEVWNTQDFEKKLKTDNGAEIQILNLGDYNTEFGGPDFTNAKIKIGNITYSGDIEIDLSYRNWKTHGHHIDIKYNKVILHLSFKNENNRAYVYTKDGRKIPSINLSRYIKKELAEKIGFGLNSINESNQKIKCFGNTEDIDYELKKRHVASLGNERFKKKCDKILDRLKELSFLKSVKVSEPSIQYEVPEDYKNKKFSSIELKDKELWQQLFYELVFEALGYSKNKNIMSKLARAIDVPFLKRLGNDNETVRRIETALFYIAGLVPDTVDQSDVQLKKYCDNLFENWTNISRIYDGVTFNKTQWHFMKIRPQNFPTIRLAGGSILLNEIINNNFLDKIITLISSSNNIATLSSSLKSLFIVRSEGFWQSRYTFETKAPEEINYFIGSSRVDEIVINIVIPFFTVYFQLFDRENEARTLYKLFANYYQKSENKIVKEIGKGIGLERYMYKSLYTQGMVELFRSYCSKDKCLECKIGKAVFN